MEATTPSITWLNMSGDITVTWDKENEAAMLELIEQKMKVNYSFFIIKPRALGLLGKKKVRATSIDQVRKAGSVVTDDGVMTGSAPKLHDADVERAVSAGYAHMAKPASGAKETVRRALSAEEVVQNQTVAVRPIVGG